MHKTLGL